MLPARDQVQATQVIGCTPGHTDRNCHPDNGGKQTLAVPGCEWRQALCTGPSLMSTGAPCPRAVIRAKRKLNCGALSNVACHPAVRITI